MAYKRKLNDEQKNQHSLEHLRPLQPEPKTKVDKKRRDKSIKNAHIKVYNQAQRSSASPSKHGKKNSGASWDSTTPGKLPAKTG